MRDHPQSTVVSALATLSATVSVANSVHDPVDAPDSSQDSGGNGPPQTRDQECADDGGVVLVEVLVCALGRVERKHSILRRGRSGLHLFVRGVFVGIGDLGCLAEGANTATVPCADEEGADDGTEDVAGVC